MSDCMSSSPFDADSIMKWFSCEESSNVHSVGTASPSTASPAVSREDSQNGFDNVPKSPAAMSSIPVLVGSDVVQLSVPVDLLCALMLSGQDHGGHYTLQDLAVASDNLKRFRDVSGKSVDTASTTGVVTGASSILSTPAATGACVSREEMYTNCDGVDIVSMALDGHGSVMVQEMLMKANEVEKELIFNQLMTNSLMVCGNTHGCRVVQRALECGNPSINFQLLKSLPQYKLVDLCMDVNGNHVMQKFVETLSQSTLHELVMLLTEPTTVHMSTITRLSLHSYGCRVVQRLLVRCSEEDRSTVLGFIIASYPDLVSDQFGNYVAQHSLEYSNEAEKKSIIATLTVMDVSSLCCNKFASNVLEKAIRIRLQDKTVLHRLIATAIHNEESLLTLMKDKYGNYVVKAICDLSQYDFPEIGYVKTVLIQNAVMLKKYTYGFHLVEKLERASRGQRERVGSGYSEGSSRRERAGSNYSGGVSSVNKL